MIKEGSVVALTGMKRLSMGVLWLVWAVLFVASISIVAMKLFGLVTTGLLISSGTATAKPDAGANLAFFLLVTALLGWLAKISWNNCRWIGRSLTAPLAEDLNASARVVSRLETATKEFASDVKSAVNKTKD